MNVAALTNAEEKTGGGGGGGGGGGKAVKGRLEEGSLQKSSGCKSFVDTFL